MQLMDRPQHITDAEGIELLSATALEKWTEVSNNPTDNRLVYCQRITSLITRRGMDMLTHLIRITNEEEDKSIEMELHLTMFQEEIHKMEDLLIQTHDIVTMINSGKRNVKQILIPFPHFTTQTLYHPWNEIAHELNRLVLMLENRLRLDDDGEAQRNTDIVMDTATGNPLLGVQIDGDDDGWMTRSATRSRSFPSLTFYDRLYDIQGRLSSRGRSLVIIMCAITVSAIIISSVLTAKWSSRPSSFIPPSSINPTQQPSRVPHSYPSIAPTVLAETHSPSISPTTIDPTIEPTVQPSFSQSPTQSPSAVNSNWYPLFKSLLVSKPAWGVYCAEKWTASTTESGKGILIESKGTGHDAITTNIDGVYSASGYGAVAAITFLKSTIDGTVLWPKGSIPQLFTICALTRYSSDIESKKNRILQSSSIDNWYFGHHSGNRGVASFETVVNDISMGPIMDWLVICGQNVVNAPTNLLVDGGYIGQNSARERFGDQYAMSINIGGSTTGVSENSEWEFSQLYIWNQTLSKDEVSLTANALLQYLDSGKQLC